MDYKFYCCDSETTGLSSVKNDIIELSIYRLSDDVQKTWTIEPVSIENIELGALRVNGHKLDDLKLLTKFGRDTYREPKEVIVEIENWLQEDGVPAESRC